MADLSKLKQFIYKPQPLVKTRLIPLDIVLGGGYCPGDMISLSSDKGIGKTTVCLHMAKNAAESGKRAAFLDVESGVKEDLLEKMGLQKYLEKDQFYLNNPMTIDEVDECLRELVASSSPYDLIFLDSLTAVNPSYSKDTKDKAISDSLPGLKARQEAELLAKYKPLLRRSGATMILITQMRASFDFARGSSGLKPAGGKSSEFTPDVRIMMSVGQRLTRTELTISGEKEAVYGNVAHIWTTKNRNERPEIMVDIPIIFGAGVSNILFLRNTLATHGFISGGHGGNYTVDLDGEQSKVRGGAALQEFVRESRDKIVAFLETKGLLKLTQGEVK